MQETGRCYNVNMLIDFVPLFFSFRLQKMCKIANKISNESTLHAIIDILCE